MADDIGIPRPTVTSWFQRGSIPAKYDAKIIEAARRAGHVVTPEDLFWLRHEIVRGKDDAA